MTLKHKVIREFQFVSNDKKIFILKIGTILEEYNYKVKNEVISIDKDIVDNNPEFFETVDWKSELLVHLKATKVPQPSQVVKKLVPFMEDMILSSMQQSSGPVVDESIIKELERKDSDLNSRERRIKDKEEEIDIRLQRVEKREQSYKDDLSDLDKKEDMIRSRSKELTEKQLDIEDKLQDLKERERNIDRTQLESGKDMDVKYVELQRKMDKDLRDLSEKEKSIEILQKQVKAREAKIDQREAEVDDKIRNLEIRIDDLKNWESDSATWKALKEWIIKGD